MVNINGSVISHSLIVNFFTDLRRENDRSVVHLSNFEWKWVTEYRLYLPHTCVRANIAMLTERVLYDGPQPLECSIQVKIMAAKTDKAIIA